MTTMGSLSLIVLVAALGGGISLFLLLRAVMSGPSPQMRKRFDRVQERPMAKSRNPEQATLRRTEDDSVWIAVFVPDDGPVKYYRYDRADKKATFLFTNRPELSPAS